MRSGHDLNGFSATYCGEPLFFTQVAYCLASVMASQHGGHLEPFCLCASSKVVLYIYIEKKIFIYMSECDCDCVWQKEFKVIKIYSSSNFVYPYDTNPTSLMLYNKNHVYHVGLA